MLGCSHIHMDKDAMHTYLIQLFIIARKVQLHRYYETLTITLGVDDDSVFFQCRTSYRNQSLGVFHYSLHNRVSLFNPHQGKGQNGACRIIFSFLPCTSFYC